MNGHSDKFIKINVIYYCELAKRNELVSLGMLPFFAVKDNNCFFGLLDKPLNSEHFIDLHCTGQKLGRKRCEILEWRVIQIDYHCWICVMPVNKNWLLHYIIMADILKTLLDGFQFHHMAEVIDTLKSTGLSTFCCIGIPTVCCHVVVCT